jgi:hypothetical protein
MYILTYSLFKKIVAKFEIYLFILFIAKCKFSTLINYSANMCRTSYEPTVCIELLYRRNVCNCAFKQSMMFLTLRIQVNMDKRSIHNLIMHLRTFFVQLRHAHHKTIILGEETRRIS